MTFVRVKHKKTQEWLTRSAQAEICLFCEGPAPKYTGSVSIDGINWYHFALCSLEYINKFGSIEAYRYFAAQRPGLIPIGPLPETENGDHGNPTIFHG